MFGYVFPDKAELKIKDFTLFRAAYCGVCKQIGRQYGFLPRLAINYDFAFLVLLLGALSDKEPEIKPERCVANPFKKRPILHNEFTSYAADMNVILAYKKAADDLKDNGSPLDAIIKAAFIQAYKKAARRNPEAEKRISSSLEKLDKLEKEKCSNEDEVAGEFGILMEALAKSLPMKDKLGRKERALSWMLYNLGRWIYLADACNDLEKDKKEHKYNPIIAKYGNKTGLEGEAGGALRFNLTCSAVAAAKSYELLDIKRHRELMDNILYLGLPHKIEQIFNKRS
ncbi:MAG: DUF5685 family protein [Bacillota bacterium]|nr:DUF5685 family protein [Bacillota bacterium]